MKSIFCLAKNFMLIGAAKQTIKQFVKQFANNDLWAGNLLQKADSTISMAFDTAHVVTHSLFPCIQIW